MPPLEQLPLVEREPDAIDKLIAWVGSAPSLALHTVLFILFFALSLFGELSWDTMLLVLTTAVSLEAIYLAIFIQMTVNRHTVSLREVEQDIDEIEEDIEEMSEEDLREEQRDRAQAAALESLTADVRRLLVDLEQLKHKK